MSVRTQSAPSVSQSRAATAAPETLASLARPTDRQIALRLFSYLKPYRGRFLAGVTCGVFAGLLPISVAWMVKLFFQQAQMQNGVGIGIVCLSVVGLYSLSWLLRYGQSVLLAYVAQRVGLAIRTEIYAHIQSLSLSFFHARRTGSLLSVLTSDVPKLQDAAMFIRNVVATPIEVIAALAALLWFSWKMTLATLVIVPIMGMVINRLTKQIRAYSRESQDKTADIHAIMEETLAAPRIVKAFSAEAHEVQRFVDANEASFAISMRNIRRTSRLTPTVDLIGACAASAAIWFGGTEIISGRMKQEDLLAFIMVVSQLARSVGSLGSLKNAWEEMMGAADRIFGEVLTVQPEIQDAPDAVTLPPMQGNIVFDHVTFRYSKDNDLAPTLDDICLTVEPGEIVAFVGETGAGKSTLVDLVPRFYDPDSGAVRIDGHDLRSVTVESLRKQIAIVPQETLLFSGTIRDNIAYGRRDATDDEVVDAARAANADRFIQRLPDGYLSRIGERGATLSGGERQRIAIARALLANPRLLILDEATSALDAQTEALVQEALDRLMRDRTTLIIAHRLSTIIHADKIFVLQRGRIAESGNHESLMAQGGLYRALYETQRRITETPAAEA